MQDLVYQYTLYVKEMKATEAEYVSSFQSKDPVLENANVCAYQFTFLTIPARLQA